MSFTKKVAAFFFLILLSSAGAWGAVSRTGSCSASATSCTFSATNAGDLKIVFAFDSGSRTIPTTPAGWTTIDSGATAAGGTTAAFAIGCNKSSSSSDTGTGAWTSATAVVGISYAGTNVGSTGNCNTSGLGATAKNNAKSSTSADYPAITLQNASNTSWVAGWLGGTAPSTCTPAGMTNVSATGTVRGSDTNGTVSTWPDTTCTVTSETWMSSVTEVKILVICAQSIALLGVGCR